MPARPKNTGTWGVHYTCRPNNLSFSELLNPHVTILECKILSQTGQ